MAQQFHRRHILRAGAGLSALLLLAGCDTMNFNLAGPGSARGPAAGGRPAPGRNIGNGRVRVALLLPLSGDPTLAAVGTSMANAAQLAMDYVAAASKFGDNITLTILDTGPSAQGAAQQANQAVAQGVSLILGPLKADQVQAAGAVAKAANIPLIGFSNNPVAAAPGVYLLSVLPGVELHRSLGYAAARSRKSVAAVFSTTPFGQAQQTAFEQVAGGGSIAVHGTYSFGSDAELRDVVAGLAPQLLAGTVDTLFIPDRATAPNLAAMFQRAGMPQGKVLIVGSADWDRDPAILATPALAGAVYPAVDPAGYAALRPEYAARFGSDPHPLATIAYTAAILANAPPLVDSRYSAAQLTMPGGFNGRDGVFRFLPDGRSQYALVIKQVEPGGARQVDGPKL
jgi:branched-chain amino acid transport system substrate-binding protein